MHKLKTEVKGLLHKALPSRVPPVLVCSMGRSGSTVLFEALSEGMARFRFKFHGPIARRLARASAFEPEGFDFRRGVVYKSHCFPEEIMPRQQVRPIFLFSRPSDVAISVLTCLGRYGPGWTRQHLSHLRASGPINQIPFRDVLRLEEQIDAWSGARHLPILGVRYEKMWLHATEISRFVGFPVNLPPQRPRDPGSEVEEQIKAQIRANYAALDDKVSRMGDVFTNESSPLTIAGAE